MLQSYCVLPAEEAQGSWGALVSLGFMAHVGTDSPGQHCECMQGSEEEQRGREKHPERAQGTSMTQPLPGQLGLGQVFVCPPEHFSLCEPDGGMAPRLVRIDLPHFCLQEHRGLAQSCPGS